VEEGPGEHSETGTAVTYKSPLAPGFKVYDMASARSDDLLLGEK